MSAARKIHQMIDWYVEMGITTAVSDKPCNHFDFVPTNKVQRLPSLKSQQTIIPPIATAVKTTAQSLSPVTRPPSVTMISANSRELANTCQTIDELKQALMDFEGCPLKVTATNLVFSDGNPQAKIMVVGEAPGADEDRVGTPFVGDSGKLLDNILKSINLDRTQVYITNVVSWRPPGNRPPTTPEIAQCLPFVERHIELINPKLLILVGGVATKAILNASEGIMKLRGQWCEYKAPLLQEPIRTIPIYHPSFLIRSPSQKALTWEDMMLIEDEIKKLNVNEEQVKEKKF